MIDAILQETPKTIRVVLNGEAAPREFAPGRRVAAVLADAPSRDGLPYVAALLNNAVLGLRERLDFGGELRGLTAGDPHGWRVFQRSMGFLLTMAVRELHPDAAFRIHHSVGQGLFCTLVEPGGAGDSIADAQVLAALSAEMLRLAEADLPIKIKQVGYVEALRLFEDNDRPDKVNLLRHRNDPRVKLLSCNGFVDLFQGPLVDRTGLLRLFELLPYESGFVLNMPTRNEPLVLPKFVPQPHLLNVYQEHIKWGHILGVQTVGQLNEAIFAKRIREVIQMTEALHDKKLAEIAEQICARSPAINLVLIAGPSSAGKTTSAKRLATHLRVNGKMPVVVGTDDYFVGDEQNPRDEDGKLDYEHIEALDLEALNRDLEALLSGHAIKRRVFDFKSKQPLILDEEMRLPPDGILIMEGLHGLNPRLTEQVPRERKFLIYLSALTQLSIDNNNRISTTDNRLIRRIIRDNKFRGHNALRSMRLWPSVRRGEERWIFPFQQLADVTFNTALDYELAVLKPYIIPLLTEIKPDMPEYTDARRLMGFLSNFYAITADCVPGYSILREYIGDSLLEY